MHYNNPEYSIQIYDFILIKHVSFLQFLITIFSIFQHGREKTMNSIKIDPTSHILNITKLTRTLLIRSFFCTAIVNSRFCKAFWLFRENDIFLKMNLPAACSGE